VFDPTGGPGGVTEADRLTASIRQDLQRITPALDALQNVIAVRKAEAARVGAVPGGKHLPAAVGVGGGGGGGGGGGPAPPGGGPVVDPVSTVQGLSHSDAVLAGLNGQLLGVVHNLKGVAAARSETVAKSVERRNMFGGGGAARDLGRPLGAAPAARAPPLPFGAGAGGGGSGGGSGRDTLLPVGSPGPDFSAVTQAQLSRDPELQYLNSRAQDVAGLESTIAELGTLFSRLASVVVEQGAQVERIDSDLEAANRDLEAGQAQLQKSWQSASSNSGLALRVMGVLVSFAVFYGVVLV
jgi:hypothetical protein